jgi:thiol-disulfide isomerase/thioredoxin
LRLCAFARNHIQQNTLFFVFQFMRKIYLATVLFFGFLATATSQTKLATGWWRASLLRGDGNHIVFNIEMKNEKGKPVWYVRNATEKIPITNIQWNKDSLVVRMPLFESSFYLKNEGNKILRGTWVRGTTGAEQVMPVLMEHGKANRFDATGGDAKADISGRWSVVFSNERRSRPAIAEFKQTGSNLTGTFLNPAGDYRFLEGIVDGDTLRISTFDGHHAYYFKAKVEGPAIIGGSYIAGPTFNENWIAAYNENASLPDSLSAVQLKPGEERLDFRYPDLDSNLVSIHDEKFKNKVVVIQLMGSWCANCMDETAFLSEFYNKNKQRGIEAVALAYEYSTDFQRSRNSLRKFQQRFNVKYPMLITGVRSSDSLRTEKTLPQLTTIRMLPTTIFIGKDGKVKKVHTGFNGPGTGEHYERFKKEFNDIIDELLKS